jgi:O-antigen/teichoic acid export membrane protein
MTELGGAAIMLLLLLGGSGLGMLVRPFLSERHRSRETTDLIQLVLIMLVTFAGLMLGLLTTSVKTSFDTINDDLRGYL